MPCLELSIPRLDFETKQALNARLTEAFVDNTRFDADIFGIRYLEYDKDQTSSGGKKWSGGDEKPYIHFVFYGPRLTHNEKQKLVKAFTESYTDCIGKSNWQPVIYIIELPYDNIGVKGSLLSKADKERAKTDFYYKLPKD
ncbi:MAG: hypothetical protein GY839_19160 [candidate division Zixibacteria bacterium]|nr:hypothetical protein [candidate division Zixibacteria bacterium]